MSEVSDNWTQLGNGKPYYLDSDGPAPFDIEQIAHSLGRICRFSGNLLYSWPHYSVAEHCVHMAGYCLDESLGYDTALYALLHDAPECVTGDIPSPIKRLMPDLHSIEDGILRDIYHALGHTKPAPHIIKLVHYLDLRALRTERDLILRSPAIPWSIDAMNIVKLPFNPKGWGPIKAAQEYEAMYRRITNV